MSDSRKEEQPDFVKTYELNLGGDWHLLKIYVNLLPFDIYKSIYEVASADDKTEAKCGEVLKKLRDVDKVIISQILGQ